MLIPTTVSDAPCLPHVYRVLCGLVAERGRLAYLERNLRKFAARSDGRFVIDRRGLVANNYRDMR